MHNLTSASAAVIMAFTFAGEIGAQGATSQLNIEEKSISAPNLSLEEAVKLALTSDDPYLLEPGRQAAALEDRAVSDGQLPDPKLRVNFANWPLDSFSYTQEAMTQFQLGVSQAFPRGNTLQFRRAKRKAQAVGERFRQELRQREIILDTRLNWLDLYYWSNAGDKVRESRKAISELIEVIQAIFATGRETSQDILRAQLELSLLDDRLVEIERKVSVSQANLARRIGDQSARRPITTLLPGLAHPSDLTALIDVLPLHPAAKMYSSRVEAADKDVNIASEQYKPGWTVNVGYGARGADRADFASVGVVMDIPLFTAKRQDRQVAAAKKSRQASRMSRDTVLLDLRKNLQGTYADWTRLRERVSLYQSVVLKRAKETTEASLTSYQSGVTDFAELVRARLAELDAELNLIRLQSDRLKAQAQLLFLEGEDDA